jgi:hypothetical protein
MGLCQERTILWMQARRHRRGAGRRVNMARTDQRHTGALTAERAEDAEKSRGPASLGAPAFRR